MWKRLRVWIRDLLQRRRLEAELDEELRLHLEREIEAGIEAGLSREQVPISETLTLAERLAGWFRPLRMAASVVSYAGALAIILCGLGLYATLAGSVARRTREIGIRQAIGSTARQIVELVVGRGMRLVGTGILAGVGIAFVAVRLLDHLLYGPAAADALMYVASAAIVGAFGLAACWIPARRAAAIDPMEALRVE